MKTMMLILLFLFVASITMTFAESTVTITDDGYPRWIVNDGTPAACFVQLSNLITGRTYSYRVTLRDATGNNAGETYDDDLNIWSNAVGGNAPRFAATSTDTGFYAAFRLLQYEGTAANLRLDLTDLSTQSVFSFMSTPITIGNTDNSGWMEGYTNVSSRAREGNFMIAYGSGPFGFYPAEPNGIDEGYPDEPGYFRFAVPDTLIHTLEIRDENNAPQDSISGKWRTRAGNALLATDATIGPGVYRAPQRLLVPGGVTLTIRPGTILKFPDRGALVIGGTLDAQGTAQNPIAFTSLADDAAGGDTNNDGDSEGEPGDWHGVIFAPDTEFGFASAPSNLKNCFVRFAGRAFEVTDNPIGIPYSIINDPAAVYCVGASPTLTRTTIFASGGSGLFIYGECAPTLDSCQVSQSSLLNDGVHPGIVARSYLYEIQREPTAPIIRGCTIRANPDGGIYLYGEQVTGLIEGCAIERNGPFGVKCDREASPQIKGNTVSGHFSENPRGAGIVCGDDTRPLIRNNLLHDNLFPLQVYINHHADMDTSNHYSNNRISAVWVATATDTYWAPGTQTWPNVNLPYLFPAGVTGLFAGNTVTLAPGVIFKFLNDRINGRFGGLDINGTFIARGTAKQPIIFTGADDDSAGGDMFGDGLLPDFSPGQWGAIRVYNTWDGQRGTFIADHCIIRCGGGNETADRAMLVLRNVTNRLTNSSIAYSQSYGIAVLDTEAVSLSDCNIHDNYGGIVVDGNGGIILRRSAIHKHQTNGVAFLSNNWEQNLAVSLIDSCGFNNNLGRAIWIRGNDRLTVSRCVIDGPIDDGGFVLGENGRGIVCDGGANPMLTANVFLNCRYPLLYSNRGVARFGSGNVFAANTLNAVYVTSTNIMTGRWMNPGVAYVFKSQADISADEVVQLDPGVVFKFRTDRFTNKTGGLNVYGTLLAAGDSLRPIVFTSLDDDEFGGDADGRPSVGSPGDWGGIGFDSGSRGSLFKNCVVRYAGFSDYNSGTAVWIAADSLVLERCVISLSLGAGISTGWSGIVTTIRNCSIQNNNGLGIWAYLWNNPENPPRSSSLLVENCLITQNQQGGLLIGEDALTGMIRNNIIRDNGPFGISCHGRGSPKIHGNNISGHRTDLFVGVGIRLDDYARPEIKNNVFEYNDAPIEMPLDNELNADRSNSARLNMINGISVVNQYWFNPTQTWRNVGLPYVMPPEVFYAYGEGTITIEPGVVFKFRHDAVGHGGFAVADSVQLIAQGTTDEPIIFTHFTDDEYGGDTNGRLLDDDPTARYWGGLWAGGAASTLENCLFRFGGSPRDGAALYTYGPVEKRHTVRQCVFEENPFIAIWSWSEDNSILSDNLLRHSQIGIQSDYSAMTSITHNRFEEVNTCVYVRGALPVVRNNSFPAALSDGSPVTGVNAFENSGAIMDAENNWWGDAGGPQFTGEGEPAADCQTPSARGALVTANVDFCPFAMTPGVVAAPAILSRPAEAAVINRAYIYDLKIRRLNAGALSVEMLNGPDWLQLDPINQRLLGTPASSSATRSLIMLRVSDEQGRAAAQEFEISLYQSGDVNLDGRVDETDAAVLTHGLLKLTNPTPAQMITGDVNGDNRLSMRDLLQLLTMLKP